MFIIIYIYTIFVAYCISFVNCQFVLVMDFDFVSLKGRIIQVMEHEGLNQAQFANEIGIQRAAMSHLVSGRNNPSLDIVLKILKRYPKVNSDWLLHGDGEMFGKSVTENPEMYQNTSIFLDDQTIVSNYRKDFRDKTPYTVAQNSDLKDIEPAKPVVKKVNKIMVFYSDSTFETFVPEKISK